MKDKKDMKMVHRLYRGFLIIEAFVIMLLYFGYTSASNILDIAIGEVTENKGKYADVGEITKVIENCTEEARGYLTSYSYFTAVLFIFMIGVSTWVAVSVTRSIKGNLAEMKKVADGLAIGDTEVEIVKHKNDEFGEVLDDFAKVIGNVKVQADIATQVADGNMLVEVEPKSEVDTMNIALKQMVTKNRETLTNISEAASQVTSGASQVASASDALAEGSTEQASAIQEITASIADVAEKTKQNAEQANAATGLMANAIGEVEKGNNEMREMMTAMEDINKASENIAKIIKVIDDIAFQTNILALNAAVEAARAGEAGKGFAVVAEEVRNLAVKSASAASETAELIEDSIRKIEVGSKRAVGTEEALKEITNVVRKSEQIVSDIATASGHQATAIAQIDQAVEQVSYVVQTNSATSEECAAASQELLEQAARVRELVAAYKI